MAEKSALEKIYDHLFEITQIDPRFKISSEEKYTLTQTEGDVTQTVAAFIQVDGSTYVVYKHDGVIVQEHAVQDFGTWFPTALGDTPELELPPAT